MILQRHCLSNSMVVMPYEFPLHVHTYIVLQPSIKFEPYAAPQLSPAPIYSQPMATPPPIRSSTAMTDSSTSASQQPTTSVTMETTGDGGRTNTASFSRPQEELV